jgi:hypothetical protein
VNPYSIVFANPIIHPSKIKADFPLFQGRRLCVMHIIFSSFASDFALGNIAARSLIPFLKICRFAQ